MLEEQPVAYANVALLSKADSTIISGTITDEDGPFSISSDDDGILMVAMLGYETIYLSPSEDMHIELKEDSAMLEGAVSVGMMVKTRATATSMVTEVKGTVLGSSGSVLEMLGKVPGMISRGDELEVLGKGSLDKPLTVIAQNYSASAVKMIVLTGGTAILAEGSPERRKQVKKPTDR